MTLKKLLEVCLRFEANNGMFGTIIDSAIDLSLYTVNELADEFECAPGTIRRWVKGTSVPRERIQQYVVAQIIKICEEKILYERTINNV